jgi:hypothetical protein
MTGEQFFSTLLEADDSKIKIALKVKDYKGCRTPSLFFPGYQNLSAYSTGSCSRMCSLRVLNGDQATMNEKRLVGGVLTRKQCLGL